MEACAESDSFASAGPAMTAGEWADDEWADELEAERPAVGSGNNVASADELELETMPISIEDGGNNVF